MYWASTSFVHWSSSGEVQNAFKVFSKSLFVTMFVGLCFGLRRKCRSTQEAVVQMRCCRSFSRWCGFLFSFLSFLTFEKCKWSYIYHNCCSTLGWVAKSFCNGHCKHLKSQVLCYTKVSNDKQDFFRVVLCHIYKQQATLR